MFRARRFFPQRTGQAAGELDHTSKLAPLKKVLLILIRDKLRRKAKSAGTDRHDLEATSEETDRRDLEAIKSITDEAFLELLRQYLDPEEEISPEDYRVQSRMSGTYNHCIIVSVKDKGEYAIKVPFTGTKEVWTQGDAHNLRSEAQTQEYLRQHTSIPIAEVYKWDDTLDNSISAPYILMRAIPGVKASKHWKPQYVPENKSTPKTEEWRHNFLKSLATMMSELHRFSFPAIGMLNFDEDRLNPTVGPYYGENNDGTLDEVQAYNSSNDFWESQLQEFEADLKNAALKNGKEDMDDASYGWHNTMRYALKTYPLKWSGNEDGQGAETFVLRHPDLDMHNILVDENDGTITGIIDWDMTRTVPRCVGFSAVPIWLRADWDADFKMDDLIHMPWELDQYRNIYAQAMAEALTKATGEPGDACYTLQSPMYCMAYTWFHGGSLDAFWVRMFKEIPHLRALDVKKYMEMVGTETNWDAADERLILALKKVLAPMLP
ncbi:hypothetical protein BU24DRAFT_478640 [Aaosphaeria arxii CBS 175.79]|uniref:Aminoglycoside phosphotransferase domain-containing protein n=1 Tax=Aaosphaeria arxii CBS 175.79 TaxID=1450172 RepID=A0A6A5XX66_9PLEO|nr:uncharacterized protein BU24DRAFT_478640 [Aaosphaeria arxii CBS 175.79]KAF2017536.1 hypothetical protein BU24DRAFT_478640 [Aaosphaeria arxii CBS 175.79]